MGCCHTEPSQRRTTKGLWKKYPKYSCPNHSGTCHTAVDRQGRGKHRWPRCWQHLWQPELELEGKLSTAWASQKLCGNTEHPHRTAQSLSASLPALPVGAHRQYLHTSSALKSPTSNQHYLLSTKLNSSSSFPALSTFVKPCRRGKNRQGVWGEVRAQQNIFFVINLQGK